MIVINVYIYIFLLLKIYFILMIGVGIDNIIGDVCILGLLDNGGNRLEFF